MILLDILFKMSNFFIYNRNIELSRVLIVSRHNHLSHITWLDRNRASVSSDCNSFELRNTIRETFFRLIALNFRMTSELAIRFFANETFSRIELNAKTIIIEIQIFTIIDVIVSTIKWKYVLTKTLIHE
jgi:hypothetical protein